MRFKFRWPIRIVRLPDKPPAGMYGDLAIVHRRGTKVITKVKVGTELHRKTNTLQYRERHINKADPNAEHSYTEKITNPTLGVVIEKDEKLANHRNKKK